ncbi:MAG TPA: alpha/beta hydrolase [Acidimicrobiia bacterium]|nr:alpha/beta hydrolase [Acidimicrobiia bacterium]
MQGTAGSRPAFSPSIEQARVVVDDGVSLAAVVAGDPDSPGLLLVHGFGGAKEDFADHLDALAVDHRVATFDHRGHGASDHPDDPAAYSLDRLGADVWSVAQALGLGDVRLLGHSMGGMAVRRAVLHEPTAARALVFMDTSPAAPPGINAEIVAMGAEIARTHGMTTLKQVSDELDPLGSEAYRRVVAERPGFAEYAAAKWASLSPVMWSTLAVEITTQPDQLDALAAAITVPTLVIVGDQDREFAEPSRAIADAVAGARFVEIPDAGHSPQFENPLAWRAAVHDFLASL